MNKTIRRAVRCFIIKDNKVVCIKYKNGKNKDFYDIPGGKIEENETPYDTVIREVKEETNLNVQDFMYRGNMIVEYEDRIFDFKVFLANNFNGEIVNTDENAVEIININELLLKDKKLSNIQLLNDKYKEGLYNLNKEFFMKIIVDNNENILNIDFSTNEA